MADIIDIKSREVINDNSIIPGTYFSALMMNVFAFTCPFTGKEYKIYETFIECRRKTNDPSTPPIIIRGISEDEAKQLAIDIITKLNNS